MARWLLLLVPGGSLIALGYVLYRIWQRRQPAAVSSQWLHERRQRHGYEFARERSR